MTEIQWKSILVGVSEGSSYRESTVVASVGKSDVGEKIMANQQTGKNKKKKKN